MPYAIRKSGKNYVVIKKTTGEVVAGNKTPLSKEEAMAAMKVRYMVESGRKLTRAKG